MTKTREANLGRYLNNYYENVEVKLSLPSWEDIYNSPCYDELFNLYRDLGGILERLPYGFNKKNIDFFVKGNIIELDEENHFTRYRSQSLRLKLYNDCTVFSTLDYKKYCYRYEHKARSNGGFWTNESCEKMFGSAAPPRTFSGNGSPRWKQRALYDTIKDHLLVIAGISIRRISIYDTVHYEGQVILINDILLNYNPKYTGVLLGI